jgi:Leucine-rich repeat (LRR) protein
VGQLGNLEQLRIGSPELRRLPSSVDKLAGLTELIVIQCSHLQCPSPEGIVAPNIKFFTIDSCPIANFSFQNDQRAMGALRDLTLKNASVSEICMVEGVYPWLQTIDLSENIHLKQVIASPSALVRVNLQNCSALETLNNLSSLVNLKFLNINGCFALQTLSVRGLISLAEIEAEKCWKLKRIEGLSCLKRLNCLKISTHNGIFWEDVCKCLVIISVHYTKH